MANNLDIVEVTLADISDSTADVNSVDTTGETDTIPRKEYYHPAVVRVTDHADDTTDEEDDPDLMALFVSDAHGKPWKKDFGLQHKIWPVAGVDAAPIDTVTTGDDDDFTVIYPDFDYSTF